MKIHYSPCKSTRDTSIEVASADSLNIDGELYEFDPESVVWPEISAQTNGAIIEARREDGELFVKVLRFYREDCPWDSGTYQDVAVPAQPEEALA